MASLKPFERPARRTIPKRPRKPHRLAMLEESRVTIRLGGERVPVRVRSGGEGSPLLLIHGLMTSSYSWRYLAQPLIEAGYRIVVPDLPGAGRTPSCGVPCDAANLTRAIAEIAKATGTYGEAVIGNSMGGYLAMRLALEEPASIRALVNLHSPGLPLRRLRVLRAALSLPAARAALHAAIRLDPEGWVWRNVHYRDESLKSLEELTEYASPLRTHAGREAFISWLRDGLDPDVMDQSFRAFSALAEFPVPLQLIYAEEDPMVPPRVGQALAKAIPSAEMHWLSKSSHFAHIDTPEAFLGLALPFLQRVSSS